MSRNRPYEGFHLEGIKKSPSILRGTTKAMWEGRRAEEEATRGVWQQAQELHWICFLHFSLQSNLKFCFASVQMLFLIWLSCDYLRDFLNRGTLWLPDNIRLWKYNAGRQRLVLCHVISSTCGNIWHLTHNTSLTLKGRRCAAEVQSSCLKSYTPRSCTLPCYSVDIQSEKLSVRLCQINRLRWIGLFTCVCAVPEPSCTVCWDCSAVWISERAPCPGRGQPPYSVGGQRKRSVFLELWL